MKKTIVMTIALAILASNAATAQVVIRRSGPVGYLGISFGEQVTSDGSTRVEKIHVREVSKDSPAEQAGVKANDEILRVNGMVATNGKFRALAGTLVEGDTVRLRVRRDNKERDITIVAAKRPEGPGWTRREIVVATDSVRRLMLRYLDSARVHLDSIRVPNIYIEADSSFRMRFKGSGRLHADSLFFRRDSSSGPVIEFFHGRPAERITELHGELAPGAIFNSIELGTRSIGGAEFSEMDEALAQYFNGQRGILTLKVIAETPADRAGLQPGDVVLKANGRAVQKIVDLRSIVAANRDGVKLEISRKGQIRTLELKPRQR